MIYLFVFNYFCFRVHYLLTSALLVCGDNLHYGHKGQSDKKVLPPHSI